jgi:outer membrane protein
MKTKAILTGFIAVFICVSLNAQVFVGGSISANMNSTKVDNGTSPTPALSYYSIGFSPTLGKFLSEKFAVGLAINLGFTYERVKTSNESIDRTSAYGINPFIRYYAIRWNKFSVFGQGNLLLNYSTSSTEIDGDKVNGPKDTDLSIYFYPGLSYDISEKLSLETGLSFINLGYTYSQTKNGDATNTSSAFSIGGSLSNISTLGTIRIGAIYKF